MCYFFIIKRCTFIVLLIRNTSFVSLSMYLQSYIFFTLYTMTHPWPYTKRTCGDITEEGIFDNNYMHNGIRTRMCGCKMIGSFSQSGHITSGTVEFCVGITMVGDYSPTGALLHGSYYSTHNNVAYVGSFDGTFCYGSAILQCGKKIKGTFNYVLNEII